MKQFIFILLLLPVIANAQGHTKMYVTQSGDTLHPNTAIKLGEGRAYDYIYLYTPLNEPLRLQAAKRYLLDDMPGQTYKIARLTRLRTGKEYKEVAVIKINSAKIHRFMTVEYFIEVESALKNGEMFLVKKGQ